LWDKGYREGLSIDHFNVTARFDSRALEVFISLGFARLEH